MDSAQARKKLTDKLPRYMSSGAVKNLMSMANLLATEFEFVDCILPVIQHNLGRDSTALRGICSAV
jgi:hypothetical protein